MSAHLAFWSVCKLRWKKVVSTLAPGFKLYSIFSPLNGLNKLECLLPSGFSRVFKHLLGSLGAYPRGLHSKVDCHNDKPYKDFTYNDLTYNINNVALHIMDFNCNWFNLSLNLLLTVWKINKKLASWKAGEEVLSL